MPLRIRQRLIRSVLKDMAAAGWSFDRQVLYAKVNLRTAVTTDKSEMTVRRAAARYACNYGCKLGLV